MNTPEELLQAYTTMFLLLGSSVTTSPAEGGLPTYCEKGLLRNLPVESNNVIFRKASRLLMSPCPHSLSCRSTISGNYHTLFVSEGATQAKPVASAWLPPGADSESNNNTIRVLYDRYGFQKSDHCDLDYDNLGIELLFVNMMLEKYLTEDDYEISDMIRKDLLTFISSGMLSWVPLWAKAVTEKSVTKCYAGIAGLVLGSLEDVCEILRRK